MEHQLCIGFVPIRGGPTNQIYEMLDGIYLSRKYNATVELYNFHSHFTNGKDRKLYDINKVFNTAHMKYGKCVDHVTNCTGKECIKLLDSTKSIRMEKRYCNFKLHNGICSDFFEFITPEIFRRYYYPHATYAKEQQ